MRVDTLTPGQSIKGQGDDAINGDVLRVRTRRSLTEIVVKCCEGHPEQETVIFWRERDVEVVVL